jgi:putative membrane protein
MIHTMALAFGAASLVLSWISLLGEPTFAKHMAAHMGVVAIAAPALAFGIGAKLATSNLYLPLLASLAELLVVWAWHTPLLHGFARHHGFALLLEQGSFFVTGLFLWVTSFGAAQKGIGIVALLLTAIHMTLLGALLALAPRVLYAHSHAADALDDQQAGGVIMLLIGGVSYLAGGLWLAWGLVSTRVVQERSQIRGVSL